MDLALRSCSPTARVFTALSLASLVTLLAGCPSSEASIDDAAVTRDGGAPRDSGPAADAAPADDAEPTRDADTTPDAEAADAAPAPDAEPAPDAAPVDAGIDLCGPVPRTAAGARLAAAIAAHTRRCNPELTAPEASWFGARGLELIGPALELPGLAYDAAEAGACGCAIEAAPCDLFDPLRELTSCRRTVTGTRAVDQPCRVTTECVEGTTCVPQFLEATGLGGLPLCSFEGACRPIVPDGMPCDFSTGACGPRSACVSFKGPGTCVPFAGLGRSCESVSCAGSEPASLGLPTTACASVNEASTCVALGRAGASCADAPCHPLYDCDEATLTCVLRPGDGDACSLSVDVATPTPDERGALIGEALYRCRVGDALGGRFSREFTRTLGGWSCVQTGTTTGRGTCRPMPTSGEACGFGPNLSASCEGASYCPGLDVSMPMSQAATCVASAGPGETCPLDGAYGAPCTPGAFCDFELRVCVDFSCGL